MPSRMMLSCVVVLVILFELGANKSSHKAALSQRRWGVNVHWNSASPSNIEELKKGFRVVRQDFTWGVIETKKGVYDFSAYDTLIHELGSDVTPYIILDYGNPIYNTNPSSKPPFPSVISMDNVVARNAFVAYAIATMLHFRGNGIVWELWNEPNGKYCCGYLDPEVYASLALAIKAEKQRLAPQLDDEVLAGPTTLGADHKYLEAIFKLGALAGLDAISFHPYRSGGPESVSKDYADLRRLVATYLPASSSMLPVISGEWGYSVCFTVEGDPAPCIGGATGGSTVSLTEQAAYLARQWLVNALHEIPISIWYAWSDGNNCEVSQGNDCYGVFFNGSSTHDPAAHGKAKPAYRVAVLLQEKLGSRPLVRRLVTKDSIFALAFGPSMPNGAPPAAAQPSARIEALAFWSYSDQETSATFEEPTLAYECFNKTSLYGVKASHPYCFNATGHLHVQLALAPDLYERVDRDTFVELV